MVAVRMVSEGVDVPRLAVGVYATSASTPLYFAQAVGRFVRSRRAGETASVFVPSVPVLLGLASELEAQRDHVLGKPHRADEQWDDELLAQAQRDRGRAGGGREGLHRAGGARRARPADLRRHVVLRRRGGLPRPARPARARAGAHPAQPAAEGVDVALPQGTAPAPRCPRRRRSRSSVREHIQKLRKELNTLVALHNHRTKKPHGVIHSELRAHCGGPPTAIGDRSSSSSSGSRPFAAGTSARPALAPPHARPGPPARSARPAPALPAAPRPPRPPAQPPHAAPPSARPAPALPRPARPTPARPRPPRPPRPTAAG